MKSAKDAPKRKSDIYTHTVNFYLQHSKDISEKKEQNIKKIQDAREITFDFSEDIERSIEVGKKVIIISPEEQTALIEGLTGCGYTVFFFDPANIAQVVGSIGALRVSTKSTKQDEEQSNEAIQADQLIWFDAPEAFAQRKGIYDPAKLGVEETLARLKAQSGTHFFLRKIKYDRSLCQYENRHQEICARCAEVCPSGSITKNLRKNSLEIQQADCIGCGRCVAVCPTGALDYAAMPHSLFQDICALYEENIVLLLPDSINLDNLSIPLPENVLPLVIEHDEFLDEQHFLTLVQTTGNPVILYTETVSELTENIVRLINDIFAKVYQQQAVFLCRDEAALNQAFEQLAPLQRCLYRPEEKGAGKRDTVSRRLAHIVGENDFGAVESGPYLHYGKVEVKGEQCTVCAGCVNVCRAGALTVNREQTALLCTPSLCTGCGYCTLICPEENCLQLVRDRLSLAPEYFSQNVLAEDELFRCIECGAGFAPAKSVKKVRAIMQPLFKDDAVKIKTLSCCPDCKAKIMLEATEGHLSKI
ncbi:MAG: 4Fe-4S dicluster domain-containing protein [Candidatus Electrothrix sp. AU1_5]|nr:4Fe-4S dicluster domain-containing protein [Candidatus Electrothrix gigas]